MIVWSKGGGTVRSVLCWRRRWPPTLPRALKEKRAPRRSGGTLGDEDGEDAGAADDAAGVADDEAAVDANAGEVGGGVACPEVCYFGSVFGFVVGCGGGAVDEAYGGS